MFWLLIAAPLLLTLSVTNVDACGCGCCGCGCCCCTPMQTVNPPLLVKLPPVRPPCCCCGGGCCGCGCCGGKRKRRSLNNRQCRPCKPDEIRPNRALRNIIEKL